MAHLLLRIAFLTHIVVCVTGIKNKRKAKTGLFRNHHREYPESNEASIFKSRFVVIWLIVELIQKNDITVGFYRR